jgi:uncharacterized protein (TIGR02246 family)
MRNRLPILLLTPAVSLLFLACTGEAPAPAPVPTTDVNTARAAVAQVRSDWIDAANRDDAAAVAQLYGEDAVLITAEGAVSRGRQAIEEVFAKAFATSEGLEVTSMSFDASGDLAYDAGRFSQEVTTPDKKPMTVSGHYLVVLKRQADGSWKLVQHISSSEPPAM